MIRTLKLKDLTNFVQFCSVRDKYSDFYITKENKRLFLNNETMSTQVFYNCLKHGDKCLIKEDGTILQGIALITGFSDKFGRKYLKIFSNDVKVIDDLLRMVTWNFETDLYIKIKKDNPIAKIAQRWGFVFQGLRDHEILFYRKFDKSLAQSRKFSYVKADDLEESN